MPTRHSLRSNLSFLVALSSLTLVACVPEVGCPPGFAVSAEGRCAGVDAGALMPTEAGMPDAYAPDASDAPDAGHAMPDACTLTTWYPDADGDGFGDARATPTTACAQPAATAAMPTDCADDDATRHPGADEICNGQDDDCDGTTDEGVTYPTLYADADHDGYGAGPAVTLMMCAASAGYAATNDDCNDMDASVHPGVAEVCNGRDDDCTGAADDGLPQHTYYADCDSDMFAAEGAATVTACAAPGVVPGCVSLDVTHGWTETAPTGTNVDCDDSRANSHPGALWYYDCDGDGFAPASSPTVSCAEPLFAGSVCEWTFERRRWISRAPTAGATDCYDHNGSAYPGSTIASANSYPGPSGAPSYDWNCDGNPTQQLTAVTLTPMAPCRTSIATGDCSPTAQTWSTTVAPACGTSGSTFTCVRSGGVCTPVSTDHVYQRCL